MSAQEYYAERLAGERLRQCYKVAPARMRRALQAEIDFVVERMPRASTAVELGCGYGRVLDPLARRARSVLGLDTSLASLRLAAKRLSGLRNCRLATMDATSVGLADDMCDIVVCIQNGLSAFGVDPMDVVAEARRIARPGGLLVFSSYAPGFWPVRLDWFRVQARHGLIGEIDEAATGDGVIVCHDGFRATTLGEGDFQQVMASAGLAAELVEVDHSTLFCLVRV